MTETDECLSNLCRKNTICIDRKRWILLLMYREFGWIKLWKWGKAVSLRMNEFRSMKEKCDCNYDKIPLENKN